MIIPDILRTALTAAILTLAAAAPAQTLLDLAAEADKAISESRWDDSAALLNEAMALNPDNPSNVLLLSNLGLVYYYMGSDSLALATLDQAVAKAPRARRIISNRAEVLAAMGRRADALRDYTTLVELDSAAVKPRCIHALLSLEEGDSLAAAADADILTRIATSDPDETFLVARTLAAAERWDAALQRFTALIETKPTPELYGARAVAYMMTDRLNDASADITLGLELDPDNRELYLYRAYLNRLRYRPDAARRDLRRALTGQ